MDKIAVVVDSTAVIDTELFKSNNNLYSLPLHLIIDGKSFRDGLDITPSEFCFKMNQSLHLPTTSQPPVGDVFKLFEELIEQYDYIIYITISSKLSGTFQTGMLVKNQLSKDKIIVFDSTFTSTIQKQMAIKALDLIKMGSSIENIIKNLEYIKSNSKIYLVVDDLKHLHRTGRISLCTSSFGKLINIKPILSFEKGEILAKKKVRTINKVYNNLIELIINEKLSSNSKIIIAHANGYDCALKLKEKVLEIYPEHVVTIEELSPVISVHTGEKSFGISWIY
ncbi:fatty acid-binding protein DegV [Clostridium botulinum]|uniref:DegV family protein n=1 Tax=Clostridium botulinum TaxID=1491 RepID=UPI00099DF702|nr:DegV family protein [Clostridium botulinum]NFA96779.1 DegV family protein [Clostridium botulinum]NFB52312.1 DegV family protein [Clostridium botulinum]NFC76097.1 DegV family protein [Clostridium botulinum]NFC86617.1 DegV family protein [Clostridium botulinum]NFD06408.1 DegV family protein [Clostridium botulinum]